MIFPNCTIFTLQTMIAAKTKNATTQKCFNVTSAKSEKITIGG